MTSHIHIYTHHTTTSVDHYNLDRNPRTCHLYGGSMHKNLMPLLDDTRRRLAFTLKLQLTTSKEQQQFRLFFYLDVSFPILDNRHWLLATHPCICVYRKQCNYPLHSQFALCHHHVTKFIYRGYLDSTTFQHSKLRTTD